MCGRFFFEGDLEEVMRSFAIKKPMIDEKTYREVFPTHEFPVVLITSNGYDISNLRWGFRTPYLKQPVINARLETVDEKNIFKRCLLSKRCLIPANGYFEWKLHEGVKIKHLIYMKNKPIFYMAGLYNSFKGNDGNSFMAFTIITKEARANVSEIHDRMPAIISKGREKLWLNENIKDVISLKNILIDNPHLEFEKAQ